MSFRRPRLRSRRHVIDIHFGDQPCYVWLPNPDEPLVVAEFADAANLASGVLDMPVEKEVLVLLDERRQVTAMFADPPTELGLFVGWCDGPGLEVPFSQTMMICVADTCRWRRPTRRIASATSSCVASTCCRACSCSTS